MVDFRFYWICVLQKTLHFIREAFLKKYFSPACIMIKYKKKISASALGWLNILGIGHSPN
jgi:hypothetical protein